MTALPKYSARSSSQRYRYSRRNRKVSHQRIERPDRLTIATCALLFVSLTLGGGGSPAEMAELSVQICALAAFGWAAFTSLEFDRPLIGTLKRDWLLGGIGLLLLLLYLLQLVPLPPSVWAQLPGRAVLELNLKAFDDPPWLPLSIAPHLTIAALLSLIPPIAAYALATRAGRNTWPWIVRTLCVFAVLTVALQMLQTTGGFFLYSSKESFTFTNGFQANRNTQGDILAILIAVLAMRDRGRWSKSAFASQQVAMAAGLMVAAVLTGSRSGMLLSAAMVCVVVFRLLQENEFSLTRRPLIALSATATVLIGGFAIAAMNPVIMRTLSRFSIGLDGRATIIWPDAIYTFQQFMPWGAGFGTFVPAFQIFESQETFSELIANRAHNEPLEILIEGGIPAAVIIGGLILAVLWRAVTELRFAKVKVARQRALLLLLATLMMVAHSMVDYPFRSMSIAVLLSTILGLVVADRHRRLEEGAGGEPEGAVSQ